VRVAYYLPNELFLLLVLESVDNRSLCTKAIAVEV